MNRNLRLVAWSLLLWGAGEGMFIYFQPLYLQQLGADPLQIGAILGLAGGAMTVAHIPAGAIADHIGRKDVMAFAWILGTASAGMMAFARALPLFVAGLVVYALTAFVSAPMSSYITAARGEWSVARALTTVGAAFSGGSILGPVAGGLLGEKLGLRAVYSIATGLFVLSTALIFFIRRQPTEPAHPGSRYRAMLTNTDLARFLGLVIFAVFAMYLSWPLTPNFLHDVRHVSLVQIGLFGGVNALGIVVFNLGLGRLAPRLGFLLSQGVVAFSVLAIWRGTGSLWFGFGYFLAGGFRTARSLVAAQVESLVSRAQMGLAFGLAEAVSAAGIMAAAPVAGWLFDRSPALPFPLSLGLIAVAALLTARWAPRTQARAEAYDPGLLRRE